jgi:uncharacterized protein (UPF0264 family)
MPPLLLISVRDAAEAAIAVASGADVIDVKDPARGSLGRANDEAVSSIILAVATQLPVPPPVTMALGELRDFTGEAFTVPDGVSGLKLGLSGCGQTHNWGDEWSEVKALCEAQSSSPRAWVAVVYADIDRADSPASMDIIRTASELNCRGVLIDTFSKGAGRLFDFVDCETLCAWTAAIHDSGMFVAIAGSLRAGDLPRLAEVPCDVVAVRGGVCSGGDRISTVDAAKIREFRRAMETAWASRAPSSHQRNQGVSLFESLGAIAEHDAVTVRGGA